MPHRHPLLRFVARTLIVLLLWQELVLAAPAPALPDLGDESAVSISPLEERRLGEEFMREARAQLDILDDPEATEYLQALGLRLTRSARTEAPFRFFLVNNPTINAFAVPGGFVGVHTGLILAARNEAELAAVLAHETAHITQRHIPRMIAESQRTMGPALAAILAGILLAASGKGGGEAAILLTTAGMAQHELNFTRSFEEEADRIGMGILDGAGFDARAMPAFFERLEAQNRLNEVNVPEFLRTHPITGRRIAESRDHAQAFAVRRNPDETGFLHAQARLRVLTTKPEEALKGFRSALDPKNSKAPTAADRYGLAVALLATRETEAAQRESIALLARNPDYLPYRILRAETDMAAGKTDAGLALYAKTLQQTPDSLALTQRYAEALLRAKRAEEARTLLDRTIRRRSDEPALYRMLATAAGEAGRPLEAHRAFGEYYYHIGQPRAAVEQFELALRLASSTYYVASLEARIREIREEAPLLFKNDQPPATRNPPSRPITPR